MYTCGNIAIPSVSPRPLRCYPHDMGNVEIIFAYQHMAEAEPQLLTTSKISSPATPRWPPRPLPLERLRRIQSRGEQDPGQRFPGRFRQRRWRRPAIKWQRAATEGTRCSYVSGRWSAGSKARGQRSLVGWPEYCGGGGLALFIAFKVALVLDLG
jgi:hypothetical protein